MVQRQQYLEGFIPFYGTYKQVTTHFKNEL